MAGVPEGASAGPKVPLQEDSVTIGRSPNSAVRLEDPAVSQEHALIRRVEGRFLLYDAGSSTGTRVNGQAMAGASLQEGSRVALGSYELVFSRVEVGTPASPDGTVVLGQEARASLLVRGGPGVGQSFPIGEELIIGREPGPGGATLNDPAVSRRHALVRQTQQGYVIYDLGSANGTVVDGARLTGRPLANGDTIEVGATVLQFRQG